MGTFRVPLAIGDPQGQRWETVQALVDTGATYNRRVMDGLYAAGELMGEVYYYNYPGATSVIRGAVFGRIAGRHAARRAK